MAVSVCDPALPALGTVVQASEVVCLDPYKLSEHHLSGVLGGLSESSLVCPAGEPQ